MKLKKKVTLLVDGKKIEVDCDSTILEAAQKNGIEIPTLCHDPSLPPIGSCLLCVVEIEKMSKLPLSCTTKVQEGMVVHTRTQKVVQARKNALEMLLSNHYADCRGPCYQKCPADVDVQGYLTYAKDGKYDEALKTITETNPFPSVCGRICVRYCEASCRRNDIDSPVAANFIKRYVADLVSDKLPAREKVNSNGKKVAVIGGGPGGLTAACFLAQKGYGVKILERHPKLGGMLRYGIPDYRLPQKVLDKEIGRILDLGIEVETAKDWGRDFTLKKLKDSGFEAVFIAVGAQGAKKMGIMNEENQQIESGIDFLERTTKGKISETKGTVLIVGGGNTAIDAARTALRTGASEVRVLYRRTKQEMPADEVEINDALEEGVIIDYLVAPLEAVEKDGVLQALKCRKMMLGEPDSSGRRRPVPIEGSEYEILCNYIISAIGQNVENDFLKDDSLGTMEQTAWRSINADEKTYATNLKGVFAAGDAVTGPMAAVDAIGAGRKVAAVIDEYLKTGELKNPFYEFISRKENLSEIPQSYFDSFEKTKRAKMIQKDPYERIQNFDEVDAGISEDDLKDEVERCLTCGCTDVYTCELKKYATEYGAQQTRYSGGKVNKYEEDKSHQFIRLDPNKCILCGRCVRTCESILGVAALGLVGRGNEMIVRPVMGRKLEDTNCIGCGNCIDVCPTGAITYNVSEELPWFKGTVEKQSVCNNCSVGCELVYNKKDEDYWYVSGKKLEGNLTSRLCVNGRFNQRHYLRDNRLEKAYLRNDSKVKEVSVHRAMEEAANGISEIARTYGPESVAVLISPKSTNEELFVAQKLARDVFSTNNIACLYDLEARDPKWSPDFMKILGPSADNEDFNNADTIVLINVDIYKDNPVTGFSLASAYNSGKKIVAISSVSNKTATFATQWINNRRGTTSMLLYEVLRRIYQKNPAQIEENVQKMENGNEFLSLILDMETNIHETIGVSSSEIDSLVDTFSDPDKKVVFVYSPLCRLDKAYGDLPSIYNVLFAIGRSSLPGNGLLLSYPHSNMQGYFNLGVYPEAAFFGESAKKYGDLKGAKTAAQLKEMLKTGKIKGVLIFGEDPFYDEEWGNILTGMKFAVMIDMYKNMSMDFVNVAIPGTSYAESCGSVTTQENKIKDFSQVFKGPDLFGYQILGGIYKHLKGQELSLEEIRRQIACDFPGYEKIVGINETAKVSAETDITSCKKFYLTDLDDLQVPKRHVPSFSTISKISE